MRLNIHGVGFFGMGLDAPIENVTARVEKVPIKGYAKPGITRRFGRLAKMSYIAASKALDDSGVSDVSKVAIVGATAMGEVKVAVDLITQIQATRGKTISPKLIPNSVHNSPVGYLSIGTKNHEPSVVVSQGWLSAEAALAAAGDLIGGGFAQKVLVVAGDEADPSWQEGLAQMGAEEWADLVRQEAFQECAAAVVVGKNPGGRNLGSIAAGVERIRLEADYIASALKNNLPGLGAGATVTMCAPSGGQEFRDMVAKALGRVSEDIQLTRQGAGTLQAGSLASLVLSRNESVSKEHLSLGFELDEMAFVHLTK